MTKGEQAEEVGGSTVPLLAANYRRHPAGLEDLRAEVGLFFEDYFRNSAPGVLPRATRLGSTWGVISRLSRFEEATGIIDLFLRGPLLHVDAFVLVSDVARGEISMLAQVDDSRWSRDEQPARVEPQEVFGAYVLSAGIPRPACAADPTVRSSTDSYAGCRVGSFFEYLLTYYTELDARRITEIAAVWRADLLAKIHGALFPSYEFTDHVPTVACSPCGVIGMASPEVPRGPELGVHLDTCRPFWALAA